jgi:hypothetical protein
VSNLPALIEPLTPADCDLRVYRRMPLDVQLLRDSKMAGQENAEVFRAAVLLWCVAWHQVPAASLPNDDVELAKFAGYGRFTGEWRKVKEEALHGFVLCSDGRLYHRVQAGIALESWASRQVYLQRSIAGNEAKKARRAGAEPPKKARKIKGVDDPSLKETYKEPSSTPEGNGSEGLEVKEQKKELPQPTASVAARGTRLSPAWFADTTDRDYALNQGLTLAEIDAEEDGFRDYWLARAGQIARKVDWRATWRTWVRKAKENRDERNKGAGSSRRGINAPDRVREALSGVMEASRRRTGG